MTFAQFLNALNNRKYTIIFVFALTVTATYFLAKQIPKTYKATASVVINTRGVDLITDKSVRLPVRTHISIIKSRRVAKKVVERMGLATEQSYINSFIKLNKNNEGNIEDFIADSLIQGVIVSAAGRDLSVIDISYESNIPRRAQEVTNQFLDAYMETVLEMNNVNPKRTADWFQKEVDELRRTYQSAQKQIDDFEKSEQGIDKAKYEFERQFLENLNSEVYAKKAELRDIELVLENIKPDLSNYSDIVLDENIEQIKKDLMIARLEFHKTASGLSSNHPSYKQLQAQVVSLKRFLNDEIESGYQRKLLKKESLVKSIQSLENAIEEQNNKLSAMAFKFQTLTELEQKLTEAKTRLDISVSKLNEIALQEKSNQSESEISVLTSATVPLTHDKPKLLKIMVAGVAFGFMLAIGLAMLKELLFRRVRIDDDISVSVGIPVIGHVYDGAKNR